MHHILILLTLFLTACQSILIDLPRASFNQGALPEKSVYALLNEASHLPPQQKNALLLDYSESFLQKKKTIAAQKLLQQIDTTHLSEKEYSRMNLSLAEIEVNYHRPEQALQILNQINHHHLYSYQRKNRLKIEATALFQAGRPLESAEIWSNYHSYLTDDLAIYANNSQIWHTVNAASLDELEIYRSSSRLVQGYVDLAIIHRKHSNQDRKEPQWAWQNEYPRHPGLNLIELRADLDGNSPLIYEPETVGLMLPLSGPHAQSGEAIQKGIFTAYYHSQGTKPAIKIYDTHTNSIPQLYQQMLSDGCQLVIGPLLKPNIEALSALDIKYPVIALNHAEGVYHPLIYQLSLAPEDEIDHIVEIARIKNYNSALVLFPDNPWGRRLEQYFNQSWQKSGGLNTDSYAYHQGTQLSQQIKTALKLKSSETRRNEISSLLNTKVHGRPTARSDIDFIFLIAQPDAARVIKPLLKFHFAGHIPVYATSHIYNGYFNPLDEDLEGIIFVENPGILHQPPAPPGPRLQLLGHDGYMLSQTIVNGSLSQLGEIRGKTGWLRLDERNQFHRRLETAYFHQQKALIFTHK